METIINLNISKASNQSLMLTESNRTLSLVEVYDNHDHGHTSTENEEKILIHP